MKRNNLLSPDLNGLIGFLFFGCVTCAIKLNRRGAVLEHMLDNREISSREYTNERKRDFTYDAVNLILNATYVAAGYYLLK